MTNENPQSLLSHVDTEGRARMVDVGSKPLTQRCAIAEGSVLISAELATAIRENSLKKGNLLEVARLAGIQAAKETSRLIPLCHPLPLDVVRVVATLEDQHVNLRAEVETTWKTGVEMEALTAVATATLTVIDMGKAIDKGMVIEFIRLVKKTGGQGEDYIAPQRDQAGSAP